ncbi:tetratricopeptide repeat protein [Tundrisphaera lichenicola]|uniref:tetratricopeptide repeat protein n=1 Tax=Tundrisphaera lichenicola TaxID=2029860 RepID=UPI003EBBF1CB
MSTEVKPMRDRRGRSYTPAIGRRLRPLLWVLLGGFAILGANGAYLSSVTALTWITGVTQQTFFYMLMIGLHLFLGFAIIIPVLVFGFAHLVTSWKRPNKSAINYGIALLICSLILLVSGLILVRGFGLYEIREPRVRSVGYWLHLLTPLLAIALYVKHRLAGPMIRWYYARRIGAVVGVVVVAMGFLHTQEPRRFGVKGPSEGSKYFFPSEAVTANGKFIPASTLMMDDYCLRCHQDTYKGWYHSAHHFSSFNNQAYLFSVRETRKVSMERDGNTQAARWCAGCHDPVPFFSGEFDDPKYDDVNNPTSQAGITCTVCHSISNVNSSRGNADYTIEEPQHYPFATSKNPTLRWINETLVKAKPEMHKRTFLKPAIKDSKFCSTCHKVGLPYGLNHYKDFLRGQNHYDTFLLSGVSGHGAKSFYYPEVAKGQCIDCHMNFITSDEFGAKDFDGKAGREIHNHLFPGANTGLATIRGEPEIAEIHAKYLREKKVRVDLFALREGGGIDGKLLGPLRPEIPALKPGKPYLVETVVRTLGLGHPFSQGTVDSNEIWVELIARADGRVIGRSGGIGPDGVVDPYSQFINVYMLDKDGKRIDRRNPQDIFVPLYNKQIPPGAGQVVHFGLEVPPDLKGPITLEAKVNYRKFDRKFMDYIFGQSKGPELPITVMARDEVILPLEGGSEVKNEPSPITDVWQRWNDYGIGLLLEGESMGSQKGELKQAEPIFQKVAELGKVDGWVNLARVYLREGRIPDARAALEKASNHPKPVAPWVVSWLSAQIDERNGFLDEAISLYEKVLATKIPARGFDFSQDYDVINSLASAIYARARQEPLDSPSRREFLIKAIATYRRALAIDTENVAAHYGLGLAYSDFATGLPAPWSGTADSKAVEELSKKATEPKSDSKVSDRDREDDTRKLAGLIPAFVNGPREAFGSKLNPLHEVVERLGDSFSDESDEPTRGAQALALAVTHKALHSMFKTDETAAGRAVGIARKNDPAADQNAQSIVIHSLHRPGAPGLEPSTGKVAARETSE